MSTISGCVPDHRPRQRRARVGAAPRRPAVGEWSPGSSACRRSLRRRLRTRAADRRPRPPRRHRWPTRSVGRRARPSGGSPRTPARGARFGGAEPAGRETRVSAPPLQSPTASPWAASSSPAACWRCGRAPPTSWRRAGHGRGSSHGRSRVATSCSALLGLGHPDELVRLRPSGWYGFHPAFVKLEHRRPLLLSANTGDISWLRPLVRADLRMTRTTTTPMAPARPPRIGAGPSLDVLRRATSTNGSCASGSCPSARGARPGARHGLRPALLLLTRGPEADIFLHIDGPGGFVDAGVAVYAT